MHAAFDLMLLDSACKSHNLASKHVQYTTSGLNSALILKPRNLPSILYIAEVCLVVSILFLVKINFP